MTPPQDVCRLQTDPACVAVQQKKTRFHSEIRIPLKNGYSQAVVGTQVCAGAGIEARTPQDGVDRTDPTTLFFLARRGWRAEGSRATAVCAVIKMGPRWKALGLQTVGPAPNPRPHHPVRHRGCRTNGVPCYRRDRAVAERRERTRLRQSSTSGTETSDYNQE